MATEVKLPELGENLSCGDVLDVKVAAGEEVSQGQTLLDVEAEKSTVEVPSPLAGRIQEMRVKKGDAIQVGQTLCLIEETAGAERDGDKGKPSEKPPEKKAEKPPEKKAEKPPEQEAEAAAAGTAAAKQTGGADGERKAVRAPARVAQEAKPAAPEKPKQEPPPKIEEEEQRAVPAGPATRRLARELGVDLAQVRGTASGGRVTQEDVKTFVKERAAAPAVPRGLAGQAPALPDFARWGEVERRALDGVRRKTAEQVNLAWSLIPHVTQHDVADVSDLEAFRKEREGRGPKLTVTAFALKASAIALKQFPQFNASLDLAAGQLILKRYCHIGVAVDTERGLLVPVVRDADRKTVHELAQELADLAERTRQKKIQLDDLRGGTFTISNLGGIGGTGFTPIINYPEVAILGLSRSRLQPVVRDGQIVPRLLLPLSLSYDHRVIDGADAARFTHRVAEMLEQPLLMLLDA
jgi:pyruvate dehydrogenase E2 component (dihydrolipoamide acetyltransferase)